MEQNKILDLLLKTVAEIRCSRKKSLQIFQKGIIILINSTKGLHSFVRQKYPGIKYVLTHKPNQDSLEIIFSQNRTKGRLSDHPSTINMIYRVRMIIAWKSLGIVQAGRNSLDTDSISEEYIVSDVLKTAGVFTEVENNSEIENSDCLPDTQPPPFDETEISEDDKFCFRATRAWSSFCESSCAPRGSYCDIMVSSCNKPHPHRLTTPSTNLGCGPPGVLL
ncbi:hypothetical protein PR048_017830 [Dryococelus australis]|uniref:Uncharacterized protein n=1 Tax=Dryococelus australis TaxID=614101 RepID=A0ABQ9HAP7_9NEOP|nr:hypothetical protein PR048_017830 [Dryococelus australis]